MTRKKEGKKIEMDSVKFVIVTLKEKKGAFNQKDKLVK